MPLGKGVKYRFKKGTKVRLAFKGGKVIEAKNTKTGATHTPEEFAQDRKKVKDRPEYKGDKKDNPSLPNEPRPFKPGKTRF